MEHGTNQPHSNTLIRVSAPARLHLGFLDLNGTVGRQFGSIGVAIESHSIIVEASHSASFSVQPSTQQDKVAQLVELFFTTLGSHIPIAERTIHINLIKLIPEHSGFGSGTQYALAIGTALCRLYNISASTPEIAFHMKRGARSGIGIATFDLGGFIVDGGSKAKQATVPPVLAQHTFPNEWRIVLIMDNTNKGVHGEEEINAFKELPRFPLTSAQTICQLTLMKLLPALVEQDIDCFGESVTEIQALIGDHFAPAQGGRYTSVAVGQLLEKSQQLGHKGISQSSWGPTGCVFVQSEQTAKQLISVLREYSQINQLNTVSFSIERANINGAKIEIINQ